MRCQRFGAAARREEEEYPATSTELEHALRWQAFAKAYFVDQVMSSFEVAGSLTDEQRSRSGYNMIVTCEGGGVWEVDSTGSPTLIADTMTDLEGPAIVPLNFGPYGWPT